MKKSICMLTILLSISTSAWSASSTLFRNANVFDGSSSQLATGVDVLVEDNLIKAIGEDLSAEGATVINASGKTLIPGLIDVHWHTSYCCAPQSTIVNGDMSEIAIRGDMGSEETLMRGFTSVRDVGGNPFSIKKMIDAGEIKGPRIFPSGPPISQT